MNKQVRIIICSMVLFTSCSMQPSQWLAGQGEKRGGPAADDLSLPDAADLETPSSDLPSDNRMRQLFGAPRVGMQPNARIIKLQQEMAELQKKLTDQDNIIAQLTSKEDGVLDKAGLQQQLKAAQKKLGEMKEFAQEQDTAIKKIVRLYTTSDTALKEKIREIEELQKQKAAMERSFEAQREEREAHFRKQITQQSTKNQDQLAQLQSQLAQQQELFQHQAQENQQKTEENQGLHQKLAMIYQHFGVDSLQQLLSQERVVRSEVTPTQTGRTSPLAESVAAKPLYASADLPSGVEEDEEAPHDAHMQQLVPIELIPGQSEVVSTSDVLKTIKRQKKDLDSRVKNALKQKETKYKNYQTILEKNKENPGKKGVQQTIDSNKAEYDRVCRVYDDLVQQQSNLAAIQEYLEDQGDQIAAVPAFMAGPIKTAMIDSLKSSTTVDVRSYETAIEGFLGEFNHPLTYNQGYKNLNQNRCNSELTVLGIQADRLFNEKLPALAKKIKEIMDKKKFAKEKYMQYPSLFASQRDDLELNLDFGKLQEGLDKHKDLKDTLRKYFSGNRYVGDQISYPITVVNNNYRLRAYIYYLLCDTPIKEWNEEFAEKLEQLLAEEKNSRAPHSSLNPQTEQEIKALAVV